MKELNFDSLVTTIKQVHEHLATQAGRAVNISLTLRNWIIGFYIQEYEQKGSDRAMYGEKLLTRLAEQLKKQGLERVQARELRRYRQLYQIYPQIWQSLTPELRIPGKKPLEKLSFTHLAELINIDNPFKRVFYEIRRKMRMLFLDNKVR